ncbi:MAG: hypothetical protein EOO47_00635 [Flavobacterium sp.]|nr:MAG: hypothetical protein EOO47_00635 [Flavobacterium sp.]
MRTLLLFLAFTITTYVNNRLSATPKTDSLVTIIEGTGDKHEKQLKIARLCYNRFLRSSNYDRVSGQMLNTFKTYDISGEKELENFIQMLILRRTYELEKASKLLTQSAVSALQNSEKTFLYLFHINQAYVQTDLDNPLNAVYNYRLARKVAEEIGDPDLLVVTDIGISDIYTNIGLYAQAVNYLDQAQEIYTRESMNKKSSQHLIYLNKAEVYFKMAQLDSLRHYMILVEETGKAAPDIDRNLTRLVYLKFILEGKYQQAIPLIMQLVATGNRYYKKIDQSHLANCYFNTNQLDSAFSVANNLIKDGQSTSSPIKLDAYRLLAKISLKRNQLEQSNHFFNLALKESEDYTLRIAKIGDLASELRLDRMEASYHARNSIYEKQRTILIMTVIVAILSFIAIFVSYRNIKQKNRFQKMLHQARSKELAVINSHQVRRPLANILGICNLLKDDNYDINELKEYLRLVQHEAKQMDDKLTEVEIKLSAQV